MLHKEPPLIVKISSSLSTAISDCEIYSNLQINVHLTSTVKLILVKFHSSILHSAAMCSAIQFVG